MTGSCIAMTASGAVDDGGIGGIDAEDRLVQVLKEKLTQPVVCGDLAVVAGVNSGIVYALTEMTGREHWRFIAGSRMDSSPTIAPGRIAFRFRRRIRVLPRRDGWRIALVLPRCARNSATWWHTMPSSRSGRFTAVSLWTAAKCSSLLGVRSCSMAANGYGD